MTCVTNPSSRENAAAPASRLVLISECSLDAGGKRYRRVATIGGQMNGGGQRKALVDGVVEVRAHAGPSLPIAPPANREVEQARHIAASACRCACTMCHFERRAQPGLGRERGDSCDTHADIGMTQRLRIEHCW